MRIRTIKPEFFKHDTLAELPPLTRLLFIGLWCLADCEGRLEDRPKRIQVEILPYDSVNVDAMLNELQAAGFIVRYEVGDIKLIEVTNFCRHQRITGKEAEAESKFPGPHSRSTPDTEGKQSGNTRETTETTETEGKRKGKGNGKGKETEGVSPNPDLALLPDLPAERTATADLLNAEAETIYQAYPRRVGKADALKAILKALRTTPSAVLLQKTQAYAAATATWSEHDQRFIPYPATWFNRMSYDDDPATWVRGAPLNPHHRTASSDADHRDGWGTNLSA